MNAITFGGKKKNSSPPHPSPAHWLTLALCFPSAFCWAQPNPHAGTTPSAAAPAPGQNPGEAVQKARTIIDQLDANLADAPTKEQLAEIDRLIEEVQTADPGNAWLSYLLGRSYALKGSNGDAIDQLRKFVSTRDGRTDWKAQRVLGDLFVTEFPRLAKAHYEKAAELMPNEPSVLTGLSNCANRSGNLDEGIRLAREAARADGYRNVRYAHRLARALMFKQEWDEAEVEANKALRVAEDRVKKQPGNRTHLQVLNEQYGLFIELYSGRIASSTTLDTHAYLRLVEFMGYRADVTNRLARHDQLAVLEGALAKSGGNSPTELRVKYAEVLAEAGRTQDALAEYESILAKEPGSEPAQAGLNRLRESQPRPSD